MKRGAGRRLFAGVLALSLGAANAAVCTTGQNAYTASGHGWTGSGMTALAACQAWKTAQDTAVSGDYTLTAYSETSCTSTRNAGQGSGGSGVLSTYTASVVKNCDPPGTVIDWTKTESVAQACFWLLLTVFFFHGYRSGDRLV